MPSCLAAWEKLRVLATKQNTMKSLEYDAVDLMAISSVVAAGRARIGF